MIEHRLEGRAFLDHRPHRQHARPPLRRPRRIARALEQLGQSDQRHEVPLVERQRALQRLALGLVVALLSKGPGKVHPELRRARIGGDGAAEQDGGLAAPGLRENCQAEHVQSDRMLPRPLDQIVEERGRFVRAVAAARLARGRQGALNLCFVHGRSIAMSGLIDKRAAARAKARGRREALAIEGRGGAGHRRAGRAVVAGAQESDTLTCRRLSVRVPIPPWSCRSGSGPPGCRSW